MIEMPPNLEQPALSKSLPLCTVQVLIDSVSGAFLSPLPDQLTFDEVDCFDFSVVVADGN